MANKKAKKAKGRSTGAGGKAPLAALYRLDAGTERGDAVRAALAANGIRARTIGEDMLGCAVGSVAGLVGFKRSSRQFAGELPEVEFMLLHDVAGRRLDALLATMRENGCSVGCKAQVTQHNRLWPVATLIAEVSREHEAMATRRGAQEDDV